MSTDSQQASHRPCGADVAAYALGALDPAEVDAFRQHLDACVVCRDELAAFAQVVDVLPLSAAELRVPTSLRRRVLRAVEQERLPSLTERPRGLRLITAHPRRPRPAFALAAAVAALAVLVGGLELSSTGTPSSQIYRAQVLGSSGSAEVRVSAGHAQLVIRHLAPPPAGKIYEVWLARPHHAPQPTSALFSVRDGDVEVPGNLRGVTRVMVTSEPAGGSRSPTGRTIIQAKLT